MGDDAYCDHDWKLWIECDLYDIIKCKKCGVEQMATQADGREALRDECQLLRDDRDAAVAVLAEFVAWFEQWRNLPYQAVTIQCHPIVERAAAIIEKGGQ